MIHIYSPSPPRCFEDFVRVRMEATMGERGWYVIRKSLLITVGCGEPDIAVERLVQSILR